MANVITRAFRNFIIIFLAFIALAILLQHSERARNLVTPAGMSRDVPRSGQGPIP